MADVLSVVERGWCGARDCSLVLRRRGISVTHLIKGALAPEVLEMVQPYSRIRLISVPRVVFRIRLWLLLVWWTMTKRIRWVLVDTERGCRELAGWCERFGITLVFIRETKTYELSVQGCVQSLDEVFVT